MIGTRRWRHPATAGLLLALATLAGGNHARPEPAGGGMTVVVVPWAAGEYRYRVVDWNGLPGFEVPGYDDFRFRWGPAPFGRGDAPGRCPLDSSVRTYWPINTDLVVRRTVYLPLTATNLRVFVAIDNHVQVFLNGHDISGGMQRHSGCARRHDFLFRAPDGILKVGANTLAVRARDVGVDSFLDLKVTAEFQWI